MKSLLKMLLFSFFIIIMQISLSAQTYKIVVMPFDKLNKEKNPELETLTVGISETLSGALSTVENFIIIDSSRIKRHLLESAEFKQAIGVNDENDIDKLRELTKAKLDGDYIIYGTFNKIGKQIQLTAKFMNVSSGKVLQGANVYGAYPDEIFHLQERLAKDLTGKISGTTANDKQNSIADYTNSTGNYAAYQEYIKGRIEQIQYDVKNYPIAVQYYKKALKHDPKYALAWAGLSEVNALWGYQIKYAGGDWEPFLNTAIEQGQKAVEYGGNLFQTHRALSMAYLNNSNFSMAQKYADEANRLNSQDAETHQILAQLKNYGYKDMSKEGTESNRLIKRSLELNPELIIARWSLAHSYSTNNDNNSALREYMEILKVNPRHAPALHGIALIYYNMADYVTSETYARRTVEADSETAQHHYTLGLALYQQSRWHQAIDSFKNAVSRNPDYENAWFSIANCYWFLGDFKSARDNYKRVLKINPENSEAKKWMEESAKKIQ